MKYDKQRMNMEKREIEYYNTTNYIDSHLFASNFRILFLFFFLIPITTVDPRCLWMDREKTQQKANYAIDENNEIIVSNEEPHNNDNKQQQTIKTKSVARKWRGWEHDMEKVISMPCILYWIHPIRLWTTNNDEVEKEIEKGGEKNSGSIKRKNLNKK